MRILILTAILAGLALCTGCAKPLSVTPLYTDKQVFDDGLPGVWKAPDEDGVVVIQQVGDKHYLITLVDNGEGAPVQFVAHLVPVGGFRILDLTSRATPDLAVAGHYFVRVNRVGDRIECNLMDTPWLRQQLFGDSAASDAVLAVPSRDVARIIQQYAGDPRAYDGEDAVVVRLR